VGWIEVRGSDLATITVPRIGKFETIGDWFELGVTNGVRGQILACPTTATVAGVFPGIWVETGAGTGVYKRWAGVGSMVNLATNPTDTRGEIFWQTTAGIRIGSDGTNNVGFLPPAGCRVRIPNIILTCCTRTAAGSGLRVLPNATLATRQEFVTTAAGDIQINNAVMNWYGNFLQAFRANVKNSALSDSLVLQEIASAIDVDNAIVAPTQAQINFGLNMVSNFGGGFVKDSTFARFSLAASGAYVGVANYNKDIEFLRVRSVALTNRANATTGTWTCTQNVDCKWSDTENIGGRLLTSGGQRDVITNFGYADLFAGTTSSTNASYGIVLQGGCVSPIINGLNFLGLANVHPYSGLLNPSASYNIKVRNIGTYAAPLSLGSANQSAYLLASSGNNDGIKLQRIFLSNTRTNGTTYLNSDNNITHEQVKTDYADTDVLAALNAIIKGASHTGATGGQVSVYGTHFIDNFTSATAGKIVILCNEPTAQTVAQCVATGGTPRFNSSGQVALTAIGDEITWEMPYFAKGHTALANLAPTNTGTNTASLAYEFQYDKGAGYNGTWLVLNAANLTGAGAINPAIGVRLKVRARCTSASATNVLTQISIPTVTTAIAQGANLYPLDVVTLTFTGLPAGCDAVVLQAGTGNILASQDAGAGTTFAYTYETPQSVDIGFLKQGYVPYYIRNLSLATNDNTIPVALVADRNFA
jgi:hypothetical protein